MQVSVNAAAYDDGRIRCDDQELIILNYSLTACADLRTSPGKHLGLSPASTAAVSPSRGLAVHELIRQEMDIRVGLAQVS
jgi:hypothetical protein